MAAGNGKHRESGREGVEAWRRRRRRRRRGGGGGV